MGSIYAVQRPRTSRQLAYLKTKKTDRKKVEKREQELQLAICDWLRATLPGVHFRSDTGSGAFNSKYQKELHNRMQSGTSEPDLMIFAAKRGYHALFIELKAEGVNLKRKRDGTKIAVRKDSKGRVIERDYKIRKKGDWSTLHIENQARVLKDYRDNWRYCASFCVGEEQTRKLICWYFDIPYIEDQTIF